MRMRSIMYLVFVLGTFTLANGVNVGSIQFVGNISGNGTASNNTNNTNPDNSTNSPQTQPLDAFHYLQVTICIFIMLTGFGGNLLVILIFSTRWSVLKTCEIFMISLAVADIIGTFTIPLDRLRELLQLHDEGSGDFIGCQISTWLASTCISVSSLTLVAIAIDRFVIVAWPLKLRHGPKFVIFFAIFITWLIGGAYAAPYFVYLEQKHNPVFGYHCQVMLEQKEHKKYISAIFILQLLIPLLVMIFLYSFIVFKLRSGSVSARRLSETDNVVRIRTLRQRKATKLFVVVVVVFTVLVLPYNILMLLLSYGHLPYSPENRRIYNCFVLMQAANSCVNPMIYSRLHKSFRKSTLSLLLGCCIPKFYRYEWESKFVSRSSIRRRWRGTNQSNTRNTIASIRKSASPVPEELATQCVSTSTPPRTLSAVSSRSSRLSSAGSDDVFLRKSSLKAASRNEDNSKLKKIPEVNSSVYAEDPSISMGGSTTPDPKPGKYIHFVNCPLQDSDNEIDVGVEAADSSDIQLHCVQRSEHAGESSSEGSSDHKITNIFTNNGYTSLNGTPCNTSNAHVNDTEV